MSSTNTTTKYKISIEVTKCGGGENEKITKIIIPPLDMTKEEQLGFKNLITNEGEIDEKDNDFFNEILSKKYPEFNQDNLFSSYNMTQEKYESITGDFYIVEGIKFIDCTLGNKFKSLVHQTINKNEAANGEDEDTYEHSNHHYNSNNYSRGRGRGRGGFHGSRRGSFRGGFRGGKNTDY